MSEPRHFILATAGHVDHGKSALIKALTGTDPDRLPEEKARGITIDLGFAALDLRSDDGKRYRLGIVDVPGHEDFVKNMVAGVGSIDLALLVVAADDGWMPQTEEHLQILSYLGVQRAVVALSKIDLATDEQAAVARVRDRLKDSGIDDAPIVPTSVVSGRGIEELKAALLDVLAKTPPPRDIGKPRLSVDRVFALHGIGTVVTGTLSGGTLSRGQTVSVQPTGSATRIRTMQMHNHEVQTAQPGSRVALNLPDLEITSAKNSRGPRTIARGDVITVEKLGKSTHALDVLLRRALRSDEHTTSRPLKHGGIVQVHHGSSAVPARVYFLESRESLETAKEAIARVHLESPLLAFTGDRFVIRDWPEQHTLGGGVVLDCAPLTARAARDAQIALVRARAKAPDDVCISIQSHVARDRIIARESLLLRSRYSADEIDSALADLTTRAKVLVRGKWIAQPDAWRTLREQAAALIDAHHQAHPELGGLPLADLRQKLGNTLAFDELIDECSGDGFARAGTAIRRAMHRPKLPPRLENSGAKLRALLAARGAEPPSRKELAPDALSQEALRFLISTGEAIEVSDEIALSADVYARIVSEIRTHLRQHQKATVSELKSRIGSNRRVMVPLLELLDRQGITQRQGDFRVLRQG
jgi:selenocysteine-specific elongation factor